MLVGVMADAAAAADEDHAGIGDIDHGHAVMAGAARQLEYGKRQTLAAPIQIGDAGDRRYHPERPVPFAGVAHGVVMRAQHQTRQTGRSTFITAADIADGIEMRAHAGLAHPFQDQLGRGAMLSREEDAGEMLAVFRDRGKLVDVADDLAAERNFGCEASGSSRRFRPPVTSLILPFLHVPSSTKMIEPGVIIIASTKFMTLQTRISTH